MHQFIQRWLAGTSAIAFVAIGLIYTAPPASAADPLTSSASLPWSLADVSASYSDTTVDAGDALVATIAFSNSDGAPMDVFYQVGSTAQSFSDLFTLDGCSGPAGVTVACELSTDGTALRVSVDALPPGATSVTVDLTVNPSATPGTYGYDQGFVAGAGATSSFTPALSFTVRPTADLAISLSATAGTLLTAQANYALAVTNNGPGAATASSVQVALPTQTSSVTGLPGSCTYSSTTDIVTCNTGAIANGATANRTFTANFGLLSIGALNATATRVGSTPTDPNGANDTATAACTALTSLIISCS